MMASLGQITSYFPILIYVPFLIWHSALKFSKKTQLIIWEITLRTKKFSKNVNHLMTQHILKSKLFDFFMELPRRS